MTRLSLNLDAGAGKKKAPVLTEMIGREYTDPWESCYAARSG